VDIEQCRSGQGFQNYQKSSLTGTSTMDGPCALGATSLQDVLCAEADCNDAANELRAAVRDKNAVSDRSS